MLPTKEQTSDSEVSDQKKGKGGEDEGEEREEEERLMVEAMGENGRIGWSCGHGLLPHSDPLVI